MKTGNCFAGFLAPGRTESEVDKLVFDTALADYGTRKHWHQRLPRHGRNTVHPIYKNVPDVALNSDDIAFVDLGPVFGDMEADFARTYVLGTLWCCRCRHVALLTLVSL